MFLDSSWTTAEQRKNPANDVQGFPRDMIGFNDVYSEHSKMQTSTKRCIQRLSSGTKEPPRTPLPAGKQDKARRQALDRAALGQRGCTVFFRGISSRTRGREVGHADPRGLAG